MFIGASLSGISSHRVRTQAHTLNNATNINLATWLATQSADTTKIQIITIPSGQIVGGTVTGNYAFTTGDLSAYTKGVELLPIGRIEGKGGAAGSGAGSHGLEVTSDIHIVDTSNIYGGGGGGGNGGLGGYGTSTYNHTSDQYSENQYQWYYITITLPSAQRSFWAGTDITGTHGTIYAWYGAPYWYRPGALSGVPGRYKISRGNAITGVKGTGGAGGRGQGYNQTKANGSGGTGGTWRAGDGGTGGNGGDWDTNGIAGAGGGTGYYIATASWNQVGAGGGGGGAGTKGNAVVENGGSIIATHLY